MASNNKLGIKLRFNLRIKLCFLIVALSLLPAHVTLTARALAEDVKAPSTGASTSKAPAASSPSATTPSATSPTKSNKYPSSIDWRSLEETLLSTQALSKPIFLLLEAPWNYENELFVQKTLIHPQVVELLNKHFLPVRLKAVDHPDIAAIYFKETYPSVTILTAEKDLVTSFEGFRSPETLTVLLHEKKDNLRPVPIATIPSSTGSLFHSSGIVSEKERQLLINRLVTTLDLTAGGVIASQKALPSTLLRYLLTNNSGFNEQNAVMQNFVSKTLSANFSLYDTVWGGVYRASALGSWNTPYFEKLASVQADNIIVYAMAFAYLSNPAFEKAAVTTGQYLKSHFKNAEGFYLEGEYGFTNTEGKPKPETFFSYDERSRKLYDKPKQSDRVYTATNFAIVEAFCALYVLTADKAWLAEAEQLAHRLLSGNNKGNSNAEDEKKPEQASKPTAAGVDNADITTAWGFRHLAQMSSTGIKNTGTGQTGTDQPAAQTTSQESEAPELISPMFISDSLRAASALLTLYETTGNIYWREESRKVFYFISTTFVEETSVQTMLGQQVFGVVSSTRQASKHWFQRRTIEDNLGLFILAVRLHYYYPEASIKQAVDTTRKFLLASVSTNSPTSLLFADLLYRTRPLNYFFINATGSEKDLPIFQDWIRSAASYTYPLKSITIGLSKETNYSYTQLNIGFPEFPKPVAYICRQRSCSLAIETPERLKAEADRILKR